MIALAKIRVSFVVLLTAVVTACAPNIDAQYARYQSEYSAYAFTHQRYLLAVARADASAAASARNQLRGARILHHAAPNHPDLRPDQSQSITALSSAMQAFDGPRPSDRALPQDGVLGLIAVYGLPALQQIHIATRNAAIADPSSGALTSIASLAALIAHLSLQQLLTEARSRADFSASVEPLVSRLRDETRQLQQSIDQLNTFSDHADQASINIATAAPPHPPARDASPRPATPYPFFHTDITRLLDALLNAPYTATNGALHLIEQLELPHLASPP